MKEIGFIIDLPKFLDERGNLSVVEEGRNIPFSIERTYWIYDVPGGERRGGHAYRENQEIIIALSGSFDIILNDGITTKTYHLCRSYYGLYIPKMIWREIVNFSTNSVALIHASTKYDMNDYIREYDSFIELKKK